MATIIIESLSTAYPRHVSTPRSAAAPVIVLRQRLRASSRLQVSVSARSAARSRPVKRRVVVCEAQKQDTAISVPDVTKATWQKTVLESDVPVLVEFWASWCGPCRMIEPIIGKLSKVYEGKLKCYKLNTDENADIATQYGIRSIPTMMLFKDGEKKDAVIGAVPESTLVSCIEKFM